jgi:hypothetical protein
MLRLLKVFGGSTLAFVLLLAMAVLPGLAAQRQIEVNPPSSYRDAVIISEVTVGNNEVQCKLLRPHGVFQPIAPFDWGDDWVQNIEIHLFNRTNKTIVAGRLALVFPELADGTSPIGKATDLVWGRIPPKAAFVSNGQPMHQPAEARAVSFGPNQTFILRVGEHADKIRSSLEHFTAASWVPSRILVLRGSFHFSDGMRWLGGTYSIPDPDHPGQWKYMDSLYFPGDRENNWPIPGQRWDSQR